MRSRDKGARGEREAAAAWSEATGATCRRGQQFSGSPDSPDVVTSQPDIHLEVKRVERGNPYDWVEQAVRDSGAKIPVVLHRRNKKPWLAIVRLDDVARLATSIAQEAQALGAAAIPLGVSLPGDAPNYEADGRKPGHVFFQRGRRSGLDTPAELPG